MPLKKGKGKEVIQENIKELYQANEDKPAGKKRGRKEIIAIALSAARGGKKK